MLTAILTLTSLAFGIFVGYSLGRTGPFWPFKTGTGPTPVKLTKVETDGFVFDSATVASIPDEAWMRLKGNPDALRRYIDQQAHSSAELIALRQGVLTARKRALENYAEGYPSLGDAKKHDAEVLERQADKLQASLGE